MKKSISERTIRRIIAIVVGLLIVAIPIAISLINGYREAKQNVPDEKPIVYTIYTDLKYMTMQNDGGSHTAQKFVIDFEKGHCVEYEDKYVGFKGYEYQDKLISQRDLSDDELRDLNVVIMHGLDYPGAPDYSEGGVSLPYTIVKDGEETVVYDKDTINGLSRILLGKERYPADNL